MGRDKGRRRWLKTKRTWGKKKRVTGRARENRRKTRWKKWENKEQD